MSSTTLSLILKGKNSHLILLNFCSLNWKRQGNSGYDLIFKRRLFPWAFLMWFLFIFLINTIIKGRLRSEGKTCFQREDRKENVFLLFLPAYVVLFQDSLLHWIFFVGIGVRIDDGKFSILKEKMLSSQQHKFQTGEWRVGCSADSVRCTGRWAQGWRKPIHHPPGRGDSLGLAGELLVLAVVPVSVSCWNQKE